MAYVAKRFLYLIPTLLIVSAVVFSLLRLTPGDPARIALGHYATEEQVQALRKELDLDKPIPIQYILYLSKLLQGDLGKSMITRGPVLDEILLHLPASLELTIASIVVGLFIGIPIGVVSAVKRNSKLDHASRLFALLGTSMPIFWSGLMLQLLFGLRLGLLPVGGRTSILFPRITGFYLLDSLLMGNVAALVSSLKHLVLPSFCMGFFFSAGVSRMTRSEMLIVLTQDYIRTARSKGLPERTVLLKHALRNALIPTVTLVGMHFVLLLGTAVVTETVFAWPGLGRRLFESLYRRDYTLVQGIVLFFALMYVISSVIVDALTTLFNPKVQLK